MFTGSDPRHRCESAFSKLALKGCCWLLFILERDIDTKYDFGNDTPPGKDVDKYS